MRVVSVLFSAFAIYVSTVTILWRRHSRRNGERNRERETRRESESSRRQPTSHAPLPLLDFLWGFSLFSFATIFSCVRGLTLLTLRRRERRSDNGPPIVDFGAICAAMSLETNFAVNVTRVGGGGGGGSGSGSGIVVEFLVKDLLYVIDDDDNIRVSRKKFSLIIEVDEDCVSSGAGAGGVSSPAPRFLSATLGNRRLSAEEAFVVVTFYVFTSGHINIHALALEMADDAVAADAAADDAAGSADKNSDGSNRCSSCSQSSSSSSSSSSGFFRRLRVAAFMSNFFAVEGFPILFRVLRLTRLFSFPPGSGMAIREAMGGNDVDRQIGANVASRVPRHELLTQLTRHSAMIDFVVKMRRVFRCRFEEMKRGRCEHDAGDAANDQLLRHFSGVDAESFFVASIVHSVDHFQFKKLIPDPLWFDGGASSHDPFRTMKKICLFLRCCFVDPLPGEVFNKFSSFSSSSSSASSSSSSSLSRFFSSIYEEAKLMNPEMAEDLKVFTNK